MQDIHYIRPLLNRWRSNPFIRWIIDKVLANIDAYSSISENPRFIFETLVESKDYKIEFFDIDGNKFNMDIK